MLQAMDIHLQKEDEILNFLLQNYGHEVFTPGLDRSAPLYQDFKKKFAINSVKIITVAGTNGKGQTAHTLLSLLNDKKKNAGLWTSPHILTIRERFSYNGELIHYDELFQLMTEAHEKLQGLSFKVSFYEFLFFIFLKWMETRPLDYLILEVGLGGRFDAVNHFDCNCALITSISRDHQGILGHRYELILLEKLGVARSNGLLFTQFKLEYLKNNTDQYCRNNQIKWMNIDPHDDYFYSNQILAIEVLKFFGLQDFSIQLKDLSYKGREEKIFFKNCEFLFVGPHNPEGMRETLKRLHQYFPERIYFSFSIRDKQDLQTMIKMIVEEFRGGAELCATVFSHSKAVQLNILEDVLNQTGHNNLVKIVDWKKSIQNIDNEKNLLQKNIKRIAVIGSYYFIGEFQRYLILCSNREGQRIL